MHRTNVLYLLFGPFLQQYKWSILFLQLLFCFFLLKLQICKYKDQSSILNIIISANIAFNISLFGTFAIALIILYSIVNPYDSSFLSSSRFEIYLIWDRSHATPVYSNCHITGEIRLLSVSYYGQYLMFLLMEPMYLLFCCNTVYVKTPHLTFSAMLFFSINQR